MPDNETLILVKPSVQYEKQYQSMVCEFLKTGEAHFNNFPLALEDFPAFIAELEDEAAGCNQPQGLSAQTTYWALRGDGTLVGEIRLRPSIPQPFEKQNGHIGYNIRPSERQKGYATRQLALVLEEARRYPLERVMLMVAPDNHASQHVIKKNGGYVEGKMEGDKSSDTYLFYWIDL